MPGTAEVLGLKLTAKRQVPFIELLRFSRCGSAGLVCAGLQLTANVTMGKKRMPRVFGFIIGLMTCRRLGLDAGKH